MSDQQHPMVIVSLTDAAADACVAAGLRVEWVASFVSECETCKWWENEGGPEHCRVVIFESVRDARAALALPLTHTDGEKAAAEQILEVLQTERIRNDYYGRPRFDLCDDEFGEVPWPEGYTPEGEEE